MPVWAAATLAIAPIIIAFAALVISSYGSRRSILGVEAERVEDDVTIAARERERLDSLATKVDDLASAQEQHAAEVRQQLIEVHRSIGRLEGKIEAQEQIALLSRGYPTVMRTRDDPDGT